MKSLADIRQATQKREEKGKIDFVKLQKSAAQSVETKRRELTTLQSDIDLKKQEVEKTGTVIVEEAKTKAAEIVQKAHNERKEVESLKNILDTRLSEIEKLAEEQKTTKDTLEQKETSLRSLQEVVDTGKKQVEAEKSDLAKAKSQANGLLMDLVSLLGVAIDRVAAIDIIEEIQKDKIEETLSLADVTIRLMNQKKKELEAKKEMLDNRERQMDTKWDIIKDQRTQLKAVQQDPMFKK